MGGAMTLKEKAVAATLGVVVLYGAAVASWFVSQEDAWRRSAKAYETAKKTYEKECALIRDKAKWNQAYEDEKAQMPTFAVGKDTDTTWLQKMDELAVKHHISISQRQGGKEIESGDVLELEIDVKSWEGALESLVRFMHELENTRDGMFDIKSISLRPSAKKGYLRGSFTLTCAYMREK